MDRADVEAAVAAELARHAPMMSVVDNRSGRGVGGLHGRAHLGEDVEVESADIGGPVTSVEHSYAADGSEYTRVRLNALQGDHAHLAQLIVDEAEETRSAARATHNRKVRVQSAERGYEVHEYPRVPGVGEYVWDRGADREVRSVVQYPQPYRFAADIAVNALRAGDRAVPLGWVAAGVGALAALGIGAWWWSGHSAARTAARALYPDGTLIKATGDEIDVVLGGVRRHIPDVATLTAQFGANPAIVRITDAALAAVPTGPDMPRAGAPGGPAPYPDGTLLKASGDPIYVVRGGQKHWVPDPATLTAQFGASPSVTSVTDAALAAVPLGAALPSVATSGAASTPAAAAPPAVGQALTSAVGALAQARGLPGGLGGLAGQAQGALGGLAGGSLGGAAQALGGSGGLGGAISGLTGGGSGGPDLGGLGGG